MQHQQAKDLYQLQTELMDMKERAAHQAIDRLTEQLHGIRDDLVDFKREVHEFKHEVHELKSSLASRLVALETKLNMVIKAGWFIGITVLGSLIAHLHIIL